MKRVHLTRQLTLEAPQRLPDEAGGFSESWVALGTLWAEVTPRTGREKVGEAITISAMNFRITVRGAPPGAESRPKPDQRFRDGNRLFLIQAVSERDPAGRFLTCFATEEVVA